MAGEIFLPKETACGCRIDGFTETISLATVGNAAEEGVAFFWRWEVQPDERAADAFAGLAVIEIAKAGMALDALGEEGLERAGPLIEVEAQKCWELDEVAAEGDGPEGDVHGVGEVLPFEAVRIEILTNCGKRGGSAGLEGEGGPCVIFGGFSVLKVGDVESGEGVIQQVEHGSGALRDADAEAAAEIGAVAKGLGDDSELEEVDVGPAEDHEDALATEVFAILQDSGEAHGSGWFGDAAQAFPEHAHGLADLGIGHRFDAGE